MLTKILLVEDDKKLGAQIVEYLNDAGYDTTWIIDGYDALEELHSNSDFKLLILDLMLPSVSGMEILENLRQHSNMPVLILSARNETFDKVKALKLGADDYMTKPFWPEELIERVKARLRRPNIEKSNIFIFKSMKIDYNARKVFINEKIVELTKAEYEIILILSKRPNETITRQILLDNALDPDNEGTERTLDVHISRLRKKLNDISKNIETVWGIGYRFNMG